MKETIEFIQKKIKDFQPELGIILGSGLGDFADNIEGIRIQYQDIPGFEKSTVAGHKGQLVFGEVLGKKAVIMQGRYHFYEGYHISRIVYPVKVMKKLGVQTLIITNAAGSVNKSYKAGDLMAICDHINLMGVNPLIGENDATLGDRFPDMSEVYNHALVDFVQKKGKELGITVRKGVYAAMSGPSYETPAEINMLRIMGADAVGMSTVPEALVANYCSMKLSHADVVETAAKAKDSFMKLLMAVIEEI